MVVGNKPTTFIQLYGAGSTACRGWIKNYKNITALSFNLIQTIKSSKYRHLNINVHSLFKLRGAKTIFLSLYLCNDNVS